MISDPLAGQVVTKNSCRPRKWMNFFIQSVVEIFQGYFHVIVCLKIEPELRLHAEKPPESQSSISRDSPTTMHYFIDAPSCYANILGESILTDIEWLKKFGQENFTGMKRREITF